MSSKKLFLVVIVMVSVAFILTSTFAQMMMHQHNEPHQSDEVQGSSCSCGGEDMAISQQHNTHQHQTEGVQSKEITIIGHVIDPLCYVTMGLIGEKHLKCAKMCAENGVNLGILEKETNVIYLAFPEGHGNPNEKLMAFIEKDVKVTGKFWEKGGLKAIQIQKVEEVN